MQAPQGYPEAGDSSEAGRVHKKEQETPGSKFLPLPKGKAIVEDAAKQAHRD